MNIAAVSNLQNHIKCDVNFSVFIILREHYFLCLVVVIQNLFFLTKSLAERGSSLAFFLSSVAVKV